MLRDNLQMDQVQDSILLIGNESARLNKFFSAFKYKVASATNERDILGSLERHSFDLILLHSALNFEITELLEFLRADELSSKIPILVLTKTPTEAGFIKALNFDAVHCLEQDISLGLLAGRIATEIRIRKMRGLDGGSIAESNAALRDLTQKIRKDLDEGRRIQEGLLPQKLPQSENFELAAAYLPLEDVGGDWYFANSREDGRLYLHIADVTGHGLSAALICSMTRLAVFSAADEPPDQLLQKVNSLLSPQLPEGRFVTIQSIMIDPNERVLSTCRGGHPPALLCRARDLEIIELKPDGFALGFFDSAEYPVLREPYEKGDLVLLYTDGLSEAVNRSGDFFGTARIKESLQRNGRKTSAKEILDDLIADFEEFRDGRIRKDDVTILLFKAL